MSAVGLFIRTWRLAHAWDRQRLAKLTGLAADEIRRHEEGVTLAPLDVRRLYAIAFGLSIEEFEDHWRSHLGRLLVTAGDPGRIPVINLAPAGEPRNYEEFGLDSGQGYTYVDRGPGQEDDTLFAVVAIGHSMRHARHPDSIEEGDLVICRPVLRLEDVPDGSCVHVRFGWTRDNTCTLKQFTRVATGLVELRPINPSYESIQVEIDEIVRVALVIECRRRWRIPPVVRQVVVDEYSQTQARVNARGGEWETGRRGEG
jgi:SOS-response transcriptional repressor LexA